MTLVEVLRADHRRILSAADHLTEDCGRPEPSEGGCFNSFRTFKALVSACTKAEEYTLYALLEENMSKIFWPLRKFVLESYVENDLIDLLLKEMGQAEELTDQFRAKLKVVKDLLHRHLEGEQEDFFPELTKRLSMEQLNDLVAVYTRERDAIYAKKSGPVKPASALASRNSMTH
ncbi:MAG: hemerythrin domain-containing protein [Bdellovibrionales bacterium]|nr:hemerythrin domain-containing protein [Bdellovibrionales bacterium]